MTAPEKPKIIMAAKETVDDEENAFDGQGALEPVQFSAGSQTPVDARHCVVELWKRSVGHVAVEPVQFSATSHTPADVRQVCVDARNWHVAVQHVVALPFEPPRSHTSVPSV